MRRREQNFFWELWQRPKYLIMPNLFLALVLVFAPVGLQAADLPTGADVTAGSATVTNDGQTMTITQTSQNTSINFDSYSIGQGNTVQYIQPNASSVALNRVVGQDPSQILGNLNANGIVYLLNPNGVLFGQTARVDVAGLGVFACDGSLGADGSLQLGSMQGNVVNEGNITVRDFIRLVGLNVTNQGQLSGKDLSLLAGKEIDLGEAAGGKISMVFESDDDHKVVNEGTISARGAFDVVTAGDIDQKGIVSAGSVTYDAGGSVTVDGDITSNGEVAIDAGGSFGMAAGKNIFVTGAGDSLTINAKSITLPAGGGVDGETLANSGGSVSLTASIISLDKYAIGAETVTLDAISNGGSITVEDTPGEYEIRCNGILDLKGNSIGTVNDLEFQDATQLIVEDTGAGAIKLKELATSSLTDVFFGVADETCGGIDLTLFNGDRIDIGDGHALTDIDLAQGSVDFSYKATFGDVQVGDLDINDDAVLFLDATSGSITQTETGSVKTGVTLLKAANGDITLTNAGNIFGDLEFIGGAVSITEDDAIVYGNINDSWYSGATTLDAGNHDITLSNNTTTTGSLALTGGNVTIDRAAAVDISGTVSGDLSITSGGDITSRDGVLAVAGSADFLVTGSGEINLTTLSLTKVRAETEGDGGILISNTNNSSAIRAEYLKTAGGDITFTQQGSEELILGVAGDGDKDISSGGDITISSTGRVVYQSNLYSSKPGTGGGYTYMGAITNNGFTGLTQAGNITVSGRFSSLALEASAGFNTGGELDTQQTYFVHQNGRVGLSEFVELGGAKIYAENPSQWPFDPNREIRTSGDAYRHSVKFDATN